MRAQGLEVRKRSTHRRDFVMMPDAKAFYSPEEYYSTLFHELAHSTGHKSRLNRFKEQPERFQRYERIRQRGIESRAGKLLSHERPEN